MTAEQNNMIEQLYLELFDKLKVYARSILESDGLAEEAIQEAFRIACQKPEQLLSSPNPQGWVFNTLKNTVRNIRSSRKTAKCLMEQYLLSQKGELLFFEDTLRVEIRYQDLADMEEFQLLKELVLEGKSHEEVAKARGITVSACKKRVQRAKEKLRARLMKSL